LPHPVRLTKAQRLAKKKMWESNRHADPNAAFTTVDFLLNTRDLRNAYKILSAVKTSLAATYSASAAQLVHLPLALGMA